MSVLALCMDPTLLDCKGLPYPSDVKERAKHILDCLKGHGIGILYYVCPLLCKCGCMLKQHRNCFIMHCLYGGFVIMYITCNVSFLQ